MIRPAQRKLLDRAREAVASDPAEFAELLRRYGGADCVDDLTAAGLARLLDHLTVSGFRDKRRPILSKATLAQIERCKHDLRISDHVFVSWLRREGASGLEMLTGTGLLNVLMLFESYGMEVAIFRSVRAEITDKQLRLLKLAQRKTGVTDDKFYPALQRYGGVNYSHDLDVRGFELMLAFLEAEGFERRPVAPAAPAFGRRPGFATPEQVDLIRTLWRGWTGPGADSEAAVEAGLNAWLERYHATSSLRFLTTARAGKVITALRAMKARAKPKGEATHA